MHEVYNSFINISLYEYMGGFCSGFTPELRTGQSGLQTVKRLNRKTADPMNLATIEDPEGVDAWAEALYSSLNPIVTGGGQKKGEKTEKSARQGLTGNIEGGSYTEYPMPRSVVPSMGQG